MGEEVIGWLLGEFWPYLAALAGVAVAFLTGLRSGAQGAQNKALSENQKREQAGRNAVSKEQADSDGLSNRDLAERMRSRDGDWRGM